MTKPSTATGSRKRGAVAVTPRRVPRLSNYNQALKYLNDRVNVERTRPTRLAEDVFKLDRIRALLAHLGNPQDGIKTVHVAGTKGKGSTCEMTAACLEACGYTVGLYMSPHLVDVRERVRINHRLIGHADFTRTMQQVADAVATLPTDLGEPTYFEVMTALGFFHFAEEAVDIAVIETGLGGRLDCTNVITPEVSAVTSISLDHVQLLGGTVEQIAAEKAGIFKPGVPALTINQPENILAVLRASAEDVGTSLEVVGRDIDFSCRFESSPQLGPHARVCLTTERSTFEHVAVPLKGEHQALNCGLALALLDRLADRGFNTPETGVVRGLEQVDHSGRLEMAWTNPRVLLDGAHNPSSVRAMIKAIGTHITYDSMVVIFGCAADKDIDGMLAEVALGADKVVFTRSQTNPRAVKPADLQQRFAANHGKMSQVADSLPEALAIAASAVGREDLICVTGSFYLVGEAKKHFEARSKSA